MSAYETMSNQAGDRIIGSFVKVDREDGSKSRITTHYETISDFTQRITAETDDFYFVDMASLEWNGAPVTTVKAFLADGGMNGMKTVCSNCYRDHYSTRIASIVDVIGEQSCDECWVPFS